MYYVLRNTVGNQWEKERYDIHFREEAAEVLESEELVQSEKADRQSYVTISGSTVTSNTTILGIPPLAEPFKLSILKRICEIQGTHPHDKINLLF